MGVTFSSVLASTHTVRGHVAFRQSQSFLLPIKNCVHSYKTSQFLKLPLIALHNKLIADSQIHTTHNTLSYPNTLDKLINNICTFPIASYYCYNTYTDNPPCQDKGLLRRHLLDKPVEICSFAEVLAKEACGRVTEKEFMKYRGLCKVCWYFAYGAGALKDDEWEEVRFFERWTPNEEEITFFIFRGTNDDGLKEGCMKKPEEGAKVGEEDFVILPYDGNKKVRKGEWEKLSHFRGFDERFMGVSTWFQSQRER